MLLVDKGVDIISLVHKKSDTDFVWTNPMGLSCLEKRRKGIMDNYNTSDNYVGGMFEILPNFGDECDFYGKVHFPQHSEVASLPWDYQVLEDSADCFYAMYFEQDKVRLNRVLEKLLSKLEFASKCIPMQSQKTEGFSPTGYWSGGH